MLNVSDEKFRLLTVVNNARKAGWDVPPETAEVLAGFVGRGLVAKDDDGGIRTATWVHSWLPVSPRRSGARHPRPPEPAPTPTPDGGINVASGGFGHGGHGFGTGGHGFGHGSQ